MSDETIGTAGIAKMLGLARTYVTDNIVKRPDFPAPVLELSQKTRRWRVRDVERYAKPKARRPAPIPPDQPRPAP